MTSLELRRVNITCFLRTVTPENLIQLRRFSTDGYCQPWEENEASSLICTLVAEIKALERLALVCQFDTDGLLAAITKHGPSLRSLALRDFDGTNARWPHMDSFLSRDNLWAIRSACPNLTDLETNIEIQLVRIHSTESINIDQLTSTAASKFRGCRAVDEIPQPP